MTTLLSWLPEEAIKTETIGYLCTCGKFHVPGKRRDHRAEFVTHQHLTEKKVRHPRIVTIVPEFPYEEK